MPDPVREGDPHDAPSPADRPEPQEARPVLTISQLVPRKSSGKLPAEEPPSPCAMKPVTEEPTPGEKNESAPEVGESSPAADASGEPAPEALPPEPQVLDTVPVTDTNSLQDAPQDGQLLEACPSCGTLMDVTDQEPFAKIHCPSCGQALRARKQFNHYKLLELVGQGGMGQVFKATDCNLNRLVALKVLKKELASSEEERAKLAEEARITASITHPHVVKVFSFGQDHGQFYMAMELVENGSLDDLLLLQKRVPEAQVLEVGIQIAQGLQAAFEEGLIHRDIKPGNLLFANAHTAKLVDFGLAIVMDQAAAAAGEIWGTPYYIAPEKLDNQPEDFRSDIYSLGGTLFHALAGRPPYEAATASMVALKQLKSQAVSLQSFAPDVSSETAYVINRMIAKNADDRYASYEELIEHLSYARAKLLERIKKPPQPKARVVLETKETRNFTAYLSLALLAVVLITGGLLYSFRDRIFPTLAASSAFVAADFDNELRDGIKLAAEQHFDEAIAQFTEMAKWPDTPHPQSDWVRMNLGLATMMAGNGPAAAATFAKMHADGLYSTEPDQVGLANFFVEAGRLLSNPDDGVETRTAYLYSPSNYEVFGLFAFGLRDWQIGKIEPANLILARFLHAKPSTEIPWVDDYKPLAKIITDDAKIILGLTKKVQAADATTAPAILEEINSARARLQSGDRANEALDKLAEQLQAKK